MVIKRLSASGNLLLLLCVMYFVTYMHRVDISTAAGAFKTELGLSNTQLCLVFLAFAYPYLVCQVIGGWFGDRFGARRTLTICGLIWAVATILTGALSLVWAALALGGAFFFAKLTIGPTGAIPMDIAPAYSGTASGLMNSGSALAAILSPLVFGIVIDATGNWSLPFYGTMALLAVGTVGAFWMRPDRTFAADAAPREAARVA